VQAIKATDHFKFSDWRKKFVIKFKGEEGIVYIYLVIKLGTKLYNSYRCTVEGWVF